MREDLHRVIIEGIDTWLEEHPEANFISELEVTKILALVSETYVKRHHAKRSKQGKNKHGEYR